MNGKSAGEMTSGRHPVQGIVSPGFERVADAFATTLTDPDSGGALCVRVEGAIVVDVWGGIADAVTQRPWEATTPTTIFSCTKGLVSILVAQLVSEGRLDYEERVTTYWPEFGAAGKEETLVRHLLSHRAGLSALRQDLTLDDILDWDRMVAILQDQEPLWKIGEGWGYHALTHGWLVGEVIRRITGRSVGQFLADTITTPLGAQAWIGLPEGLLGIPARLLSVETNPTPQANSHAPWPTVGGPVSPEFSDAEWMNRAMTMGGALAGLTSNEKPDFNDSRVQLAELPGAGGIATARALASIWSATVVPTDGVRLLTDEVIRAATVVQSEGPAVFSSEVPPNPRWAMGFMLDSERRRFLTSTSFGHDGAGGQVGFADPRHRVGFGYVTNRLEYADDTRAPSVIDAIRATFA